jgi:lysophospholipase L1-like esterase
MLIRMRNSGWELFDKHVKHAFLVLGAIAAIALAVIAFGTVQNSRAAYANTPGPVPTFGTPAVSFAAVGDSVSAGNSPNFDAGDPGDLSWAYWARSTTRHFVGGWALGGATTEAMAANTTPFKADVLVILAGTNDSGRVPFEQSAANLQKIVAEAGIKKVVVSSIPPRDANPTWPVDYNQQLQQLAQQQGWTYVDGSAALRNGGHYTTGYTADGVHPTSVGAKALGEAIGAAIAP